MGLATGLVTDRQRVLNVQGTCRKALPSVACKIHQGEQGQARVAQPS